MLGLVDANIRASDNYLPVFVALLRLDLFQVEFELFAFHDVFVRATTLSGPGGNRNLNATGSEFVLKNSLASV